MNLDIGSFAYGGVVLTGGNTPSWGTSLGQSQPDYKFTYSGAENLLIGMMYCSIPLQYVSLPLGKGGRVNIASEISECQLAALFKKVYINGTRIDYPFIMVLIKEASASHTGRRTIKYSDKTAYNDGISQYNNQQFVKQAKIKLGLADEACWFIYSIEICNQDELHMYAVIVDANNSVDYPDSQTRRKKWLDLLDVKMKEHYQAYNQKQVDFNDSKTLQQIFYGAPGTGKSHKIKDDENVKIADEKNLVFRTTFHPDSDYSTFVGAYKPTTMDVQVTTLIGKEAVPVKNADGTPKTEKKIIYEFVPQAFLQAYVAAWNNPDENVYLVIEEINRGNCAQIFGDLFQLLDRDDNGESEYPIMADRDLAKYLSGKDEEEENSKGALSNKEGIKDGKLKLPKNLYIWATMNTSDQSLFPIDSAFKRRWDWEYMPIGYKNNTWTIKIGTKEYNWVDFQTEINKKIYGIDNSEDKQLGDYFVNADRTGNEISSDTLLNKILFYLWNDVCKDDPDIIFKWVDDKDNNKEKSIKFSEFFCEKAEKERKLQGFMAFLEINVKTNEETDEPNDDNSDKDGKEFSYNGTAASMREIAAFVVSDYAKTNSGMNAQQVRDYFIETFKGIGIAHIVETESEYRKRDGQSSQERTVKSVTIPNGEIIYVSTQWRAGKESDNFYQFMKIVNEKGLGTINSL